MDGIVLHCSDSVRGSIEEIDAWHRARGFARSTPWADSSTRLRYIGYHFVIGNGRGQGNGEVLRGRQPGEPGAHARGLNHWFGVCLVGRTEFTVEQMIAAHLLVLDLRRRYSIPVEHVIGHRETPVEQSSPKPKTCPNFDVGIFRDFQRTLETLKVGA